MNCNICGCTSFADFNGRKNVACTQCGSVERTRLLWLYLDRLIRPGHKVLHCAPEKGIYQQLVKRLAPGDYVATDIDPDRYKWAEGLVSLDLSNLEELPSKEYDFIVHSHVLEHVPCNEAYTLYHLHRALKEDGRHLFIIPVQKGHYDCTYVDVGRPERERRFGQWDHVRWFGREDLDQSLGKLIDLPWNYDAARDFPAYLLAGHNIPSQSCKGITGNTVFNLGRYDMKLLSREPVRYRTMRDCGRRQD